MSAIGGTVRLISGMPTGENGYSAQVNVGSAYGITRSQLNGPKLVAPGVLFTR